MKDQKALNGEEIVDGIYQQCNMQGKGAKDVNIAVVDSNTNDVSAVYSVYYDKELDAVVIEAALG